MAKLTAKLVEEELRKQRGNFAAVGRACGVTRTAVALYIKRHPALEVVATECREAMLDDAENVLHEAVLRGEAWAVCFFLKTQGKARGYIEKSEIKMVQEIDQEVIEEVVHADSGTKADSPSSGAAGVPPE